MKRKLDVWVRRKVREQVEVDFPIYRKHDMTDDNGEAVLYSRIMEDGRCVTIGKRSPWSSTDRPTFSVELEQNAAPFDTVREVDDYSIGRGQYASSADEWSAAFNAAREHFAKVGIVLSDAASSTPATPSTPR